MGTRKYIKVPRLMEHAARTDLTVTVDAAPSIGATSTDAIGLILRLARSARWASARRPSASPRVMRQTDYQPTRSRFQ